MGEVIEIRAKYNTPGVDLRSRPLTHTNSYSVQCSTDIVIVNY
jgi:hypothetical protein